MNGRRDADFYGIATLITLCPVVQLAKSHTSSNHAMRRYPFKLYESMRWFLNNGRPCSHFQMHFRENMFSFWLKLSLQLKCMDPIDEGSASVSSLMPWRQGLLSLPTSLGHNVDQGLSVCLRTLSEKISSFGWLQILDVYLLRKYLVITRFLATWPNICRSWWGFCHLWCLA